MTMIQSYTIKKSNVEKLRLLKEKKGVSMTWIVNRAIEEYFEKHGVLTDW